MILKMRLFLLITLFCYTKGIFFKWKKNTKNSNGVTGVTASEIYYTSEISSLENEFGTGMITGSEIHHEGNSSENESSTGEITAEKNSLENEFGTGITTWSDIQQINEKTSSKKEFSIETATASYQSNDATLLKNDIGTIATSFQPSDSTLLENDSITTPKPPSSPSYSLGEKTSIFVGSEPTPTTSINPEDYDTVTSIQKILTEMKSNEIIERKIVQAMNGFSSNCNVYKPIMLSIKNFTLAPEQRIDLGTATARFFNFRISELNEEHEEWKTYTTTIGCHAKRADIIVSIPSKITTSADIEIINSSNKVIKTGSIRVILRGINILRQFFQQETNNRARKGVSYPELELTFEKSEIALDISMAYQLPIYRQIDAFFNALKPLQEFYMEQLERKMEQEGISSLSDCSHIPDPAENETLTNLYTIENAKLETYKGLSLSAGPILIEGLLSFHSTIFVLKKPDTSILRANDVPENKVTKRIKTKNLKGKFEWQYHGETNVLPFTIDRISFESIFTKKGVIGDEGAANQELFTGTTIDTDINVEVGKVEIESSQGNYCQNENHFANFVLSGYLQTLIGDLLHNSIRNRLMSELTLGRCDNF